jgi:hypothetical protein
MDNELEAMQAVYAALNDLDDAARGRVLAWAASKFEIDPPVANDTNRSTGIDAPDGDGPSAGQQYGDVGDLVDAAQPSDGPERALVVSYWFQEIEGREGFGGADVNNALKNLGHPLANVTKTLTSLRGRKPSLVMQVGKSGRSAQARKTYKLTAAGVREVRQMLGRATIDQVA